MFLAATRSIMLFTVSKCLQLAPPLNLVMFVYRYCDACSHVYSRDKMYRICSVNNNNNKLRFGISGASTNLGSMT